MTKAELGVKRRCLSCNKPFFDLNRMPIVCPSCEAVFQLVEIAHSPQRRMTTSWATFKRPAVPDPVLADLALPVAERVGEESAILPIGEEEHIEAII